ncbi:MAG: rhodanese-like domain-containing protein [Thermoanaerobaculales bacterium]
MSESEYLEARVRASISPVEVMGMMQQKPGGFLIIDVRNGPVASKIRGAIRVPESSIADWIIAAPRDQLIVLYSWDADCDLGIRAAITLLNAGRDARELRGGIAAWNQLGLPVDDYSA